MIVLLFFMYLSSIAREPVKEATSTFESSQEYVSCSHSDLFIVWIKSVDPLLRYSKKIAKILSYKECTWPVCVQY